MVEYIGRQASLTPCFHGSESDMAKSLNGSGPTISSSPDFEYPSTRYSGSKRRLLPWIWENVAELKFSSVLDVFGGTASASLLFKRQGKKVHYNDLLKFNQIIGTAIIENSSVTVTQRDIDKVLTSNAGEFPSFIQDTFKGLYFLNKENVWLDRTVSNIYGIRNKYKKALMLSALFQACLSKRPFNMFHRSNLVIRTANVKRSFGNKTTWERPFSELFQRYVREYNRAVFSNDLSNKVIGGYDALKSPNGVDLVYLDPPYISKRFSEGTDYLFLYHFLEGLADYKKWPSRIDYDTNIKKISPKHPNRFLRKTDVETSLFELMERFQENILVISYRDNGYPTQEQIRQKLKDLGKSVKVYSREHKYALSEKRDKELLFVAR
jgi:adenine-specific DNA-methyltransferase